MEFSKKQTSLIKTEQTKNGFVREGLKQSVKTKSGNGALKYSTSNNAFVDNFAVIASFKEPREYSEVSKDMQKLWSINPKNCLKLAVYIRLITRETQIVEKEKTINLEVQRGQGLKNEGIMRMLWLAINHKETFMANIPYYIASGCWKDIFQMMSLDLQYHGWKHRKLDWDFLRNVIFAGLTNPNSCELVKKYLPTIRALKDCKTIESQAHSLIGRYLATCLYGKKEQGKEDNRDAQRKYRKLKQSGTAHIWQQLISQKDLLKIDFGTIHGRALSLLVNSKFLKNQGLLEKYTEWISKRTTAKYTGFVFELFSPFGNDFYSKDVEDYRKQTINAQFNTLLETAKQNMNTDSQLLVVRDISGSMTSVAIGTTMSSYAIGKAMALYFSSLLTGPFKDAYAVFADKCTLEKWVGETPVDKWINDRQDAYGSTRFLSVAELFVKIKKEGNISENEFPKGTLLVSDGEFDSAHSNGIDVTNFQEFRNILIKGGFSKEYAENFKLIIWDLPNYFYGNKFETKFEDFADAPNNFYMSGYDPSAIAFILGTKEFKASPRNAEELFNAAMNQELLNMLTIVKDRFYNKTKKSKK